MRAFRAYRGVKIYRDKTAHIGADFNVTDDGRITPRKPRKGDYDITYYWRDGHPEWTLTEVRRAIDDFILTCAEYGITEAEAVTSLNSEEEPALLYYPS